MSCGASLPLEGQVSPSPKEALWSPGHAPLSPPDPPSAPPPTPPWSQASRTPSPQHTHRVACASCGHIPGPLWEGRGITGRNGPGRSCQSHCHGSSVLLIPFF